MIEFFFDCPLGFVALSGLMTRLQLLGRCRKWWFVAAPWNPELNECVSNDVSENVKWKLHFSREPQATDLHCVLLLARIMKSEMESTLAMHSDAQAGLFCFRLQTG